MNIKVEKRFPFGFKGLWADVYKLCVEEEDYQVGTDFINYEQSTFFRVGSAVQIKLLEDGIDKSVNNAQPVTNLVTQGEFRLVKTTDAYFDDGTKKYECIIRPNDIVKFNNEFWVCEKIDERSVYNPAKQTTYYVALRKIFDNIIENDYSMGLCEIWLADTINGSVTLVPEKSVYTMGELVTLEIVPDDGYVVDEVIGAVLDENNQFRVKGSTEINVIFKEQ